MYEKKAKDPMATTPDARPSSPSMKFTALAHSTMKNTVTKIDVGVPKAMMEFGSGIQNIRTPPVTTMPAASTWPAALAKAGRSSRSSTTPTAQITTPARQIVNASSATRRWRPRKGILRASRHAKATPPSMATPPK